MERKIDKGVLMMVEEMEIPEREPANEQEESKEEKYTRIGSVRNKGSVSTGSNNITEDHCWSDLKHRKGSVTEAF